MATLLAASLTGIVVLSVAFVTYFLNRRQGEYKVRYAGLHERRAKIVAGLFRLLKELEADFEDWIALHDPFLSEDDEKRRLKDHSSRTPGVPQESTTNTVVSAALVQNMTFTTPTTRIIREWTSIQLCPFGQIRQ
jgi:hypothetical protein